MVPLPTFNRKRIYFYFKEYINIDVYKNIFPALNLPLKSKLTLKINKINLSHPKIKHYQSSLEIYKWGMKIPKLLCSWYERETTKRWIVKGMESPSIEMSLHILIIPEAWASTHLTSVFKGGFPLIFYGTLFFTLFRTIPKWIGGQKTGTVFSTFSVAGCTSETFKAIPGTEESFWPLGELIPVIKNPNYLCQLLYLSLHCPVGSSFIFPTCPIFFTAF